MQRKIIKSALILLAVFAIFISILPSLLSGAGLHPEYKGEKITLKKGKKALIITTSHSVLAAPGEQEGNATGVFASEMTHPYYNFLDAGMSVDVASIKGGEIPVEPQSLSFIIRTADDERFMSDEVLLNKVQNSLLIDDVDFTKYDAIFLAGGWGAAYDLGQSKVLAEKISQAFYAPNSPVMGSVCHGALGFIQAKDNQGKLLIAGRKMTGVTDKQIKELDIEVTPLHPETELRKAGVIYSSETAFLDIFATSVVVDNEKRFVTGQNQNSGHDTAQAMLAIIANK